MRIKRCKEWFDLWQTKECGGGKERYGTHVELPDANGTLAHPTRIFAPGRFADDGEHSDKSGKKKEALCRRKKTEALVQHMADRSAEMVQRHL